MSFLFSAEHPQTLLKTLVLQTLQYSYVALLWIYSSTSMIEISRQKCKALGRALRSTVLCTLAFLECFMCKLSLEATLDGLNVEFLFVEYL